MTMTSNEETALWNGTIELVRKHLIQQLSLEVKPEDRQKYLESFLIDIAIAKGYIKKYLKVSSHVFEREILLKLAEWCEARLLSADTNLRQRAERYDEVQKSGPVTGVDYYRRNLISAAAEMSDSVCLLGIVENQKKCLEYEEEETSANGEE